MKLILVSQFMILSLIMSCTPAVNNQAGTGTSPQASASPSTSNNAAGSSSTSSGNPLSGSTCAAIIAQFECARDKFQAQGDAKHTKAMSNMVEGNQTVKPQLANANQICQDSYKSLETGITLGGLDREKINSTLQACK